MPRARPRKRLQRPWRPGRGSDSQRPLSSPGPAPSVAGTSPPTATPSAQIAQDPWYHGCLSVPGEDELANALLLLGLDRPHRQQPLSAARQPRAAGKGPAHALHRGHRAEPPGVQSREPATGKEPRRHLGPGGRDANRAPPPLPGVRAEEAGRRASSRARSHRPLTSPPPTPRLSGGREPPLRSAAACDVTGRCFGLSRGGTKAKSRRVMSLARGKELTGRRCKPIAISPLEAEKLGWRFRISPLQVGDLWGRYRVG